MTSPIAHSTSDIARLLLGAPGYAVGWQEPAYIPVPAAGAGWSYKADGRFLTRLLAATFTLVTSAVVANRFPALALTDQGGKVMAAVPAGGTVVASSTLTANLAVGGPAYAFGTSGGTYGFLPDLLIPGDWSWTLSIAGEDAGDQVSGITLLVQRYPNDTAMVAAGG